jgi:hypothetical protein
LVRLGALDKVKNLTKGKDSFALFDVGAGNSVLEEKITSLGGQWIGFDYMPRKEGIIELNLEKPIEVDRIPVGARYNFIARSN